jgi:hypothetical protein
MLKIHANNEFKFGGKDSSIRSKEKGKGEETLSISFISQGITKSIEILR